VGRKEFIAAGKLVLFFVIAVVLQVLLVSRIIIMGVTADCSSS
jgi:hypothetical protein